jgi:hypothetical protein
MTNCEPINCPILESLRAERCNNAATFVARRQSGAETLSVVHRKSCVLSLRLFRTHSLNSTP